VAPRPDASAPAAPPASGSGSEEEPTGSVLSLPQGLTTRAAVLGLVLCAMVLSAAVPLREFLAQRSEITRTTVAQAEQRARVTSLESRQQQLRDPVYVEQVARERPTGPERPWYGQLWDSVEAADRPAAPPTPAP
jgi:hypothetical protein